jgi:hypothetical protein
MKTGSKHNLLLAAFIGIVVIALISAKFWIPLIGVISDKSPHSVALQSCKQIALALYSHDFKDGIDPTWNNANQVLSHLVPDLQTKEIFYVPNSPWHRGKEYSSQLNNHILGAGENAFAIIPNGSKNTPPGTPLLLTVSHDSRNNTRQLIIIYVDGSGEGIKIEDHETFEPGSTTVLNRFPNANWLLPIPPKN